eukprot:3299066-Amphidinium_carterae.1
MERLCLERVLAYDDICEAVFLYQGTGLRTARFSLEGTVMLGRTSWFARLAVLRWRRRNFNLMNCQGLIMSRLGLYLIPRAQSMCLKDDLSPFRRHAEDRLTKA